MDDSHAGDGFRENSGSAVMNRDIFYSKNRNQIKRPTTSGLSGTSLASGSKKSEIRQSAVGAAKKAKKNMKKRVGVSAFFGGDKNDKKVKKKQQKSENSGQPEVAASSAAGADARAAGSASSQAKENMSAQDPRSGSVLKNTRKVEPRAPAVDPLFGSGNSEPRSERKPAAPQQSAGAVPAANPPAKGTKLKRKRKKIVTKNVEVTEEDAQGYLTTKIVPTEVEVEVTDDEDEAPPPSNSSQSGTASKPSSKPKKKQKRKQGSLFGFFKKS